MNSIIIELPNIDISSLLEVISTIKHLDVEYKITEKSNGNMEREKEFFVKKIGNKSIQIIELLDEGYTYNEIAEKTGISIDGVRYYIKKIFKSLGVNNARSALNAYHEILISN